MDDRSFPTQELLDAVAQGDLTARDRLVEHLLRNYPTLASVFLWHKDLDSVDEALHDAIIMVLRLTFAGHFKNNCPEFDAKFRSQLWNCCRTINRRQKRWRRETSFDFRAATSAADGRKTMPQIIDKSSLSRNPACIAEEKELVQDFRRKFLKQVMVMRLGSKHESARKPWADARGLWRVYECLYKEQMTQNEIADRLKTTRDKIRVRIERVEKILKSLSRMFE